jgi:replicative DNA helicase
MAKLYSSPTEAIALRSLCSRDRTVSGYIFSQVNEGFFYNEEAVEAFNRIASTISKKGEPPAFKLLVEDVTLSEETREFLRLADGQAKTIEQAEQIVGNLDKYRKTRLMYKLSKAILQKLEGPKVDVDSLVEVVSNRVAKIRVRRSDEDTIFRIGKDGNLKEVVKELLYGENNDQCIPTGFKTFDDVNGGFFRGSLVTIGGATGAGKSTVIGQLAKNQAELGYKVNVVPLEMSHVEMVARYLANITGYDNTKVLLKRLATGEREEALRKWERFERRIEKRGGRLTIFKPKQDMSLEELMAALHSYNADVTYVDYISLLKGADGEDQWRQLGAIGRFGKIYAESHNKVMALAAQVNEEGKLRYSKAVGEHSSTAWSFVATKESREKGYLNVQMFKARNQRMMNFTLGIDYASMRIYDLSPEEMETKTADAKKKGGSKSGSGRSEDGKEYLPDLTE